MITAREVEAASNSRRDLVLDTVGPEAETRIDTHVKAAIENGKRGFIMYAEVPPRTGFTMEEVVAAYLSILDEAGYHTVTTHDKIEVSW
jgi:hypothetical protein